MRPYSSWLNTWLVVVVVVVVGGGVQEAIEVRTAHTLETSSCSPSVQRELVSRLRKSAIE